MQMCFWSYIFVNYVESANASPSATMDSTGGRVRWRKDQTQYRSAAADLAEKWDIKFIIWM